MTAQRLEALRQLIVQGDETYDDLYEMLTEIKRLQAALAREEQEHLEASELYRQQHVRADRLQAELAATITLLDSLVNADGYGPSDLEYRHNLMEKELARLRSITQPRKETNAHHGN